ncbi:TIGR04013 family B12-binding domain/radical SAM domain-containing protein [Methanococcoides seepicolus]|uniref:TIGR04013 family B12-binding domain/radical SAM domain-containing protein n=1 Tax=Methanococcoides seepicolus TaxID=2828780 RepID=A0A9E4ZH55_9EURY|nr:TIGR04013 family B12-binding domain/radical SAM domain-containing protein [Methanococcoides seepicolus]MCM1988011.1 TIGR04013 family B12-binding domain/radical SAM domain-containing protein [Methanococcoides seepicolus]
MDICFRLMQKNTYSLAALLPLIPEGKLVKEIHEGIMIYSFATKQKENVFAEVDSRAAGTICIAGGPHPSGSVEETLEHFDFVVIGEGEETLPHLVNTLLEGGDVSKVKGIGYKCNGKVVLTGKRDHVDLDDYPCFDPEGIRSPIEISRGCPWNCKYCQTPRIFGHEMRHRSIDSIVSFAKYYNDLRFTSSNAFAYGGNGIQPRFDKVEALLSKLSSIEGKNIFFGTFPSEVRPEFVTHEGLDLIDKYCSNRTISLGAQSGSDSMLKEMLRGHTSEDVNIAVERCFEHEIIPVVDFIFGFPNETEEDQQRTLAQIKWISKKGGKVRAHYLSPLPSTPYENIVPSPISDPVNRVLGKMARDGKLNGNWNE